METLLSLLGLKPGAVIGGFVGALVSLKWLPGATKLAKAGNFFAGWACAAYLAPAALSFINFDEKHLPAGGFIVGMLGIAATSSIIEAMPQWIAAAKTKLLG